MPVHLSPEWLAALDEAVRSHAGLAAATTGVHLVIEQVVTGEPGDEQADIVWHVAMHDGTVRVVPGPAPVKGEASGQPVPLVRFTTDRATAQAVANGALAAQEAFMGGSLRVGGDTTALVEHHELLDGLGDVFAGVATN
jgi:hypothetical protein